MTGDLFKPQIYFYGRSSILDVANDPTVNVGYS